MREFRDYLFALQENLQFETLADIAEDFISLRDVEPLTFSITRAGRTVSEPISQQDDLTTFDAASVAVMPALVRLKASLQEELTTDSDASTLNTQQSLVTSAQSTLNSQQLAPTQQSIVNSQQLAPTGQQLIVTGQPFVAEEFTKPRAAQLQTLAEPEPFQSAKLNDEPSIIPSSLFQETELQSAPFGRSSRLKPVTAPESLKPSLSLSNLQTVLPTVLQFTESIASLTSDDLQSVASSPDNLRLDDFDQLAMKDNSNFQLSERNTYDIQEMGDFEQNSLVNQITNQTLFIGNNSETSVKLPFTESAAFLPKQSFTFNNDFFEPRQTLTDGLDSQGANNRIVEPVKPANFSLKAISESAALRAIAIIEESLSQELEGRLA